MAISPIFLRDRKILEVQKFEKLIDDLLIQVTLDFKKSEKFTISAPNNLTGEIFGMLREKYISSGWKSLDWRKPEGEICGWLDFES